MSLIKSVKSEAIAAKPHLKIPLTNLRQQANANKIADIQHGFRKKHWVALCTALKTLSKKHKAMPVVFDSIEQNKYQFFVENLLSDATALDRLRVAVQEG